VINELEAVLVKYRILQCCLFRTGLANLFEDAGPNYLLILKKYFHVPTGILKTKIRSWSLP